MKKIRNNQNNIFVKCKEKYGENFLSSGYITQDDIYRNAKNIIRDIIKSNLDLSEYGKYLMDPHVLEALIRAINEEVIQYSIISDSLRFTRMSNNNYVDNSFIAIENKINSCKKLYSSVLEGLIATRESQNPNNISIMVANLGSLVYNPIF